MGVERGQRSYASRVKGIEVFLLSRGKHMISRMDLQRKVNNKHAQRLPGSKGSKGSVPGGAHKAFIVSSTCQNPSSNKVLAPKNNSYLIFAQAETKPASHSSQAWRLSDLASD